MSAPISKQVARSTPFDNSTNGFTSTDTQSAIEEVNATVTANNRFPRRRVYATETFTVRYEESMVVYQRITIEQGGRLVNKGEIRIL